MDLFDGIEVDRDILEQTNPIFNTAKMTPYILSEVGDENAKAISDKLVTFKAVDATNYATLEAALEGVDGSLCITTEGLLFYFAQSEIEALCANIRRILTEHGGCWLLADPEITLIYITSPGLRVLLMMYKGSKDGVVLHNVNNTVREVLIQTGIGDLLAVD